MNAATVYRRAHRPADRRLLGGVSAGLADHLGINVVWVRLAFVGAALVNGAGVIAYLLLWRFLPLQRPESSPGIESATRRGLRSGSRVSVIELVRTIGICAIGIGVAVLLGHRGGGFSWSTVLPVLVALAGVALIWRQFDDARWDGWLLRDGGPWAVVRLGAGVTLIALGGLYVMTQERGWSATADLLTATVVAVLGLGLILGPWIASLIGDLSAERRERVRSQERADMAAHLHDSVLQTLALLQKNSADPALVATLARRQERDLRSWLYGDEDAPGDTLAAALRATAAEVEEAHRVPVEVIVVGDADLDADLAALARAAREAMVNAAKHAQVERIDVYAEVGADEISIFVRDRGIGFDPEAVAEDRMGLRGSIIGRVERHGGRTVVRSAPGEGTEIRLTMPKETSR